MRRIAFRLLPLLCLALAACGSGGGGARAGDYVGGAAPIECAPFARGRGGGSASGGGGCGTDRVCAVRAGAERGIAVGCGGRLVADGGGPLRTDAKAGGGQRAGAA